MTPTKEQIIERAKELWFQDRLTKQDTEAISITPEYDELLESGYIYSAQCELMRNSDEYKQHLAKELAENVEDYEAKPKPLTCDITEAMRTGIYLSGTSGIGKSDLAMHISDRMMSEGITVLVVDTSQDWIQRSNIPNVVRVEAMTDFKLSESTIFDTSRLSVLGQGEFIEKLCAMIWLHQTTVNPRKPIFVWFEEGHTAFPLGAFRSKKYAESVRLVSVGRNVDVRIGIITQFASLLSKDVMKYMKQRYFGFTTEPNDVDYIAGFIGSEKAKELRILENGQFTYNFNGLSKLIEIQPHEQNIEPKVFKPIWKTRPQQTLRLEQSNLAIGYVILGIAFIGVYYLVSLLLG